MNKNFNRFVPILPLYDNTKHKKHSFHCSLSYCMKLNAKQHGTCNADHYDRIKYTGALVWHLKQRGKYAALLSHKGTKHLPIP
jgi:hypothetical protein